MLGERASRRKAQEPTVQANENVRLHAEIKQLRGVVSELQAAVAERDGLLGAWREFGWELPSDCARHIEKRWASR